MSLRNLLPTRARTMKGISIIIRSVHDGACLILDQIGTHWPPSDRLDDNRLDSRSSPTSTCWPHLRSFELVLLHWAMGFEFPH